MNLLNKMKILYHHNTLGEGGEGIHIHEIVKSFKKLGHEVCVDFPNKRKSLKLIKQNSPQFFVELGKLFFNFINYYKLKKTILKQKPDLIYVRYALFDYAPIRIAKKFKVPLVLEVNNPLVYIAQKYEKLCFVNLAKRLENKIFLNSDAIISVSNTLKNYIKNTEKNKIYVIHNGVDLNKFKPKNSKDIREKYNLKNKIVIGFVGSFSPWHGLCDLLKTANKIVKRNKNIHFLIVGDGKQKKILVDFVNKNNLNQYVTFVNNIPHSDIPSYVSSMDITIMPNSNFSGSPLKIFEYLAMKKPCIAMSTPAIKEIITHGYDGYLINDVSELNDAIPKLIEDKVLREKLGKNGRKTILERDYTWDNNVKKIIEIYKSLKYGN